MALASGSAVQRLKPGCLERRYGTAEAVPLYVTGSGRSSTDYFELQYRPGGQIFEQVFAVRG
jgi:hypothetical protein